MASRTSKVTTDHEQIRRWAEERGGRPAVAIAAARDTEAGSIRIDFPGYGGEGALQEISWAEWFDTFDRNNLAFLHEHTGADGQPSNVNKLVSRDTVSVRKTGARVAAPRTASRRLATSRTTQRRPAAKKKTSTRKATTTKRRKSASAKRKPAKAARTKTGRVQARRPVAAKGGKAKRTKTRTTTRTKTGKATRAKRTTRRATSRARST